VVPQIQYRQNGERMSITLSKIMHDYLNEGDKTNPSCIISETFLVPMSAGCSELPLQPIDFSQWEIVSDPTRFKREFKFATFPEFKGFLDEVLDYQEEAGHHAKIMLEGLQVLIEVHTHDVNDITELDQEYVQAVDQIYRDVQDYFLTDGNEDGWG
jgi:pterin-4a-carbinolamine dehydratase